MTSDIRLGELRQRTYVEYHEDGLSDILVGAGALSFALSMFKPDWSLWLVTVALAILYVPLKNRVTVPRLGYVRFDSRHGPDIHRFAMVLATAGMVAGLVVAGLASGISPRATAMLYQYFPLLLGMLGAAAFATVAAVLGIRRYYAYAVLAAGLGAGANAGGWTLAAAMAVLGATLLIAGVALLVRFVRRHPVLSEGSSGGA